MLDLLNIPKNCRINHKNTHDLQDRIFSPDETATSCVARIDWVASIKPALTDMAPVRTESIRYDEIEVLYLEITDTQELYHICAPIYKAISYPCLLVVQLREKFLLSVCPFSAGKADYDKNILHSMAFSHWIFPDMVSPNARKLLDELNKLMSSTDDIESVYNAMRNAIQNFSLGGLTKRHVATLTKDMVGTNSEKIYASCTPYKKYSTVGTGVKAKYSARSNQFIYRYDTEDLWYAFMTNENTRKVIEGRRYRNMEDLIYSIDSKYEDYSQW